MQEETRWQVLFKGLFGFQCCFNLQKYFWHFLDLIKNIYFQRKKDCIGQHCICNWLWIPIVTTCSYIRTARENSLTPNTFPSYALLLFVKRRNLGSLKPPPTKPIPPTFTVIPCNYIAIPTMLLCMLCDLYYNLEEKKSHLCHKSAWSYLKTQLISTLSFFRICWIHATAAVSQQLFTACRDSHSKDTPLL